MVTTRPLFASLGQWIPCLTLMTWTACSAPAARPSPACVSPTTGAMPCAPCDVPSTVERAREHVLAEAAHLALLKGEVATGALSLGALPGDAHATEPSSRSAPMRYFVSDAVAGPVEGYAAAAPDPEVSTSVLFSLATVGYSGSDRVHVRVVKAIPSGTPPSFHREATTYYCVVVGPDGVGRPIPLWFY